MLGKLITVTTATNLMASHAPNKPWQMGHGTLIKYREPYQYLLITIEILVREMET